MARQTIRIEGAREHNLKNLSLEIPRERLVVITGLSGSGKSSLAFDTIHAEGQRKYVESLSAYARQFLDQLQKPDVDRIEGLSPTLAIEQRSSGGSPRSIVATSTEIYDFLRLLYAHTANPYCPETGEAIAHQTTTDIVDALTKQEEGTRLMILAPVVSGSVGDHRQVLERLARDGFVRARVDGEFHELAGPQSPGMDPRKAHSIDVVVDRLVQDGRIRTRLVDSVETALKWGQGRLVALLQDPADREKGKWRETLLSNRMFSPGTGKTYEVPTPQHFSFNAPHGACPECHGLGHIMEFDPDLVVPDPDKSLEAGAVVPWTRGGSRMVHYYRGLLNGLAARFGQSMAAPFRNLSPEFQKVLLQGDPPEGGPEGEACFEGVLPQLTRLHRETKSESTRKRLKPFMGPRVCRRCQGERLRPELLSVTLGDEALRDALRPVSAPRRKTDFPGLSIMDVCRLSVDSLLDFFQRLEWSGMRELIARDLVREITNRLNFLHDVGLGYLTLNRESATLSGGEAQRIRLATQIGAGLVGVLYVLDEPSIGLHQRDNERLLETLENLRDMGNSVLVVEHDEDTIRRADHVIDLGPGAGVRGGEIMAQGTLDEVLATPRSLTAQYLRGDLTIPIPKRRRDPCPERGTLEVLGARENNLRNIDAAFPLGLLTCVTGVSGSGKSTLVDGILRRALLRRMHGSRERPGLHREIRGTENLDKVVVIDQTPIGRTPRSNPATYTGLFQHIRTLFARLPAARVRGYDTGRFSFNVRGGRCEKCQGDGVRRIEMHFLPPVFVTCEACGGRRYNRETLEIHHKGRNIADVLELSVDDAVGFFRAVPQIHEICQTLAEVGLGYLLLGQAATTLSGGEAQRVKLAAELSRKATGRTLYILDEPTTGLHFHDIARLLELLFRLRDAGNTLIVIEHNLDVVKSADWVLDLGPEGGSGGGQLLAAGPPERIAECAQSQTGRFLHRILSAGGE